MSDSPGVERFSLDGRVVLITGARGGLGLEMARGMAAAGARVGINGRDANLTREAAAAIPNAFAVPFDITDIAAAGEALDSVVARHGRLDCLVNNAALRDRRPLQDIAGDDLRRLLETNLVAAYELSRLAARHMEARGGGRLIFITSMVGPQSFQGDPAYTSSKGGLSALMRALAVELGPKGITANAIAPGFFLTDVNAAFFDGPQARELGRRIPPAALGPARRAGGSRDFPGVRRGVLRERPRAHGGRGAVHRALANIRLPGRRAGPVARSSFIVRSGRRGLPAARPAR